MVNKRLLADVCVLNFVKDVEKLTCICASGRDRKMYAVQQGQGVRKYDFFSVQYMDGPWCRWKNLKPKPCICVMGILWWGIHTLRYSLPETFIWLQGSQEVWKCHCHHLPGKQRTARILHLQYLPGITIVTLVIICDRIIPVIMLCSHQFELLIMIIIFYNFNKLISSYFTLVSLVMHLKFVSISHISLKF